jgi:subtilase family serine protease
MPHSVSEVSPPLPPFDRPPRPVETKRDIAIKALMTLVAAGAIVGCASTNGSLAPRSASSSLHVAHNGMNISRALPAASPTPIPSDQAGCAPGPASGAACGVQKNGAVPPSKTPVGGLTAAQLRSAYGLPAAPSTGVPAGPLVAVVVAFDNPSAEADLGAYRTQFGLPPCTSANKCFQKIQLKPVPGNPPPAPAPPPNSTTGTTWSDERALDLAMVSAACPTCRIALVESVGQDLDSLASAVTTAASYQPAAISNSWGVPEGGGNAPNIDAGAQAAFDLPGIAITASAGDLGTGQVQFPASSPYVTAVGGTSLTPGGGARSWTESEWNGSGDGCSIMIPQPAWQTAGSCGGFRSVPDVSVLGDSVNPGVAVFNTTEKGWIVLGGTSVGAPFVAGLYAAAADYGASTVGAPNLYANLGALNPVAGANGSPNGLTGF